MQSSSADIPHGVAAVPLPEFSAVKLGGFFAALQIPRRVERGEDALILVPLQRKLTKAGSDPVTGKASLLCSGGAFIFLYFFLSPLFFICIYLNYFPEIATTVDLEIEKPPKNEDKHFHRPYPKCCCLVFFFFFG